MDQAKTLGPIDLDNPVSYAPLDPAGMAAMVSNFPIQCREAMAIGESFIPPAKYKKIDNVLVCGLGGSAIAGDLVGSLNVFRISVPFRVSRQYELPAWTKENTLVILSSYSGNTEETLSSFQQALNRKAKIICITSGGKLAQLASENKIPMMTIPGGFPPRAATGYLIFPLLLALEKCGLIPSLEDERRETLAVLEAMSVELSPSKPALENDAKTLAKMLLGKLAFIYGACYLAPVALRWQTQLNENSKVLAHAGELPEMNHNEVVAWSHRSQMADKLAAIFLRTKDEHPRVSARFDLTKRIISENAAVKEYWCKGQSRLARQMSLVYLGDFASLYLAFLAHKDPMEITAINFLKGELAKISQ
jgi:glucose/mannose-6-phosphate isomerase